MYRSVRVLCVLAGVFAAAVAHAESWPTRLIKVTIPFGPGSAADVVPRLVFERLAAEIGQPIVIENRPGAGGAIGARAVATAAPDGYTLMAGNTSVLAVIPAVSMSAGYNPSNDFAPVANVSQSFQILVVHPSFPAKTLKEFLDYVKANPGKLNYANTGPGGLPHLTGELFKARTGIDIVPVSYRSGGESVTAVLSQAVQMTFESITILLPLIREGKVRALGITSAKRSPLAPDLPTMAEQGVADYEVLTFNGIVAPKGTPAAIVNKLNAAINEGLKTPQMQDTITKPVRSPRPARPSSSAPSSPRISRSGRRSARPPISRSIE